MVTTIPTRQDVPVDETWDLSPLYPSAAAWEADVEQVLRARDALVGHKGQVGASAENLLAALEAQTALSALTERLYIYAMLKRDEDTSDADALSRYERVATLATQIGEDSSFLTPEILAIPPDQLAEYAADPRLAAHRHNLEDLIRQRPHVRSAEIEAILAASAELARAPGNAFTALDNADLSFGIIPGEDGEPLELTKGRVAKILQGRNRDARRRAYEAMSQAYLNHQHTLAALHGAAVRRDSFYARMRGHQSARDAALFETNIPPQVYDSLIAAVRGNAPAFQRYLSLRQRVLDIPDALRAYDLNVPLAEVTTGDIAYRDAVGRVLEGLAPLGERYVADLRQGLNSRWVDVWETRNKRSGGYNIGPYGAPPYILLNWAGTRHDLFTLAHEAGHAMHSFYANQTQPFQTANFSIFLAEVASTVNETLLTWHELDRARTDSERFAVLATFLDDVKGTIVRQTMFAEFEDWTHARIEAGDALTAEGLAGAYRGLYTDYFGDVTQDDYTGIEWGRIPHFYRGFYVFQYATGLAAAIALARDIRAEGPPAVERYLALLRAGAEDYPIELLRRAGVDMTTPEPVNAALTQFAEWVDEASMLWDKVASSDREVGGSTRA